MPPYEWIFKNQCHHIRRRRRRSASSIDNNNGVPHLSNFSSMDRGGLSPYHIVLTISRKICLTQNTKNVFNKIQKMFLMQLEGCLLSRFVANIMHLNLCPKCPLFSLSPLLLFWSLLFNIRILKLISKRKSSLSWAIAMLIRQQTQLAVVG